MCGRADLKSYATNHLQVIITVRLIVNRYALARCYNGVYTTCGRADDLMKKVVLPNTYNC